MKYLFSFLLCLPVTVLLAQAPTSRYIRDGRNGCKVWDAGYSPQDSVAWDGACKNRYAEGEGTLVWYVGGKETERYTGSLRKGKMDGPGRVSFGGNVMEGTFRDQQLHGYGKVTLKDGRHWEGNFVNGEFLDLDSPYLARLERRLLSSTDSAALYIGDGDNQDLHYYALIPPGAVQGVLVLLPAAGDKTEYTLSCTRDLCQRAFDAQLAVIVPSLNAHLSLDSNILRFLNRVFADATDRYHLPRDRFVLGGFSLGGLMALRYAELALEKREPTEIVPVAAFSADGPTDLETLYHNAVRGRKRNPQAAEPAYIIKESEQFTGGSPEQRHDRYVAYSVYSHTEENGGNAQYLRNFPLRIYNDVDVNWWIDNRGSDLYGMNALDQSAMISYLRRAGNKRAEFINAYGKGYRLEGNRHPHSWSIVDAKDCISWIQLCLEL